MALQKRRQGKHRIRSRRAAWAAGFKKPAVQSCPSCGQPKAGHRVCLVCGHYKGEVRVEVAQEPEE